LRDWDNASEVAGSKASFLAAKSDGLDGIWGVSSNATQLTSSNWASFRSAVLSGAAWAQANGIHEFQIGNEEEFHNDGTTLTDAQLIANMKALATDVQAVYTIGEVTYSCFHEDIWQWVAAGKGDIDRLCSNVYCTWGDKHSLPWQYRIDLLVNTFGLSGTNLTEFSVSTSGLPNFHIDQNIQAAGVSQVVDYIRSKGIETALFYNWHDYAGGYFGCVDLDEAYRKLWNVIQAQTAMAETDIVTGGQTIIITLYDDTWVTSGATFNAQRQNIIDGITSAQSEATGWNAEVRDNMAVTDVVRTSDTVVTVTLPASAGFSITARETIMVTVPATALTGGVALTSYPKFYVEAYPSSLSQSASPSLSPSISPSESPSISPSVSPSVSPSASLSPSLSPSVSPSVVSSKSPSVSPSLGGSISPSVSPSASKSPSVSPSISPSASLSPSPSASISPSRSPSASPSAPAYMPYRVMKVQGTLTQGGFIQTVTLREITSSEDDSP
jgi:hypothetical protein